MSETTKPNEINGDILRSLVQKFRNQDYNNFVEKHTSMFDEICNHLFKAAEIGYTETTVKLFVDFEPVKFEKYIRQYYRSLDIDTEFNWNWLHRDVERINNTVNVKFSWRSKDE